MKDRNMIDFQVSLEDAVALQNAMSRNNWCEEDFEALLKGDHLAKMRHVFSGGAKIKLDVISFESSLMLPECKATTAAECFKIGKGKDPRSFFCEEQLDLFPAAQPQREAINVDTYRISVLPGSGWKKKSMEDILTEVVGRKGSLTELVKILQARRRTFSLSQAVELIRRVRSDHNTYLFVENKKGVSLISSFVSYPSNEDDHSDTYHTRCETIDAKTEIECLAKFCFAN